MSRPLRVLPPGSIQHIMGRGNRRQDIFELSWQWQSFLDVLAEEAGAFGATILAYCLMPNHFHLLVRIGLKSFSQAMHRVLGSFATRSNRTNARSGHVFQDRFKSVQCRTDEHAKHLAAYIHRNPVRAGLVEKAADWPWSSHGAYLEGAPNRYVDPSFILALFSEDPVQAVRRYSDFVDGFRDADPFPSKAAGQSLEELTAQVERETGLPPWTLVGPDRSEHAVRARDRLIRIAVAAGHHPDLVAGFLHRDRASIFRALRR